MRFSFKSILALSLPMAFLAAPTCRAGLLNDWNVILTGDAYVTTETEGPVRIGGNLYVDNTYNISPRAGTMGGTGGYGLIVGGNVTAPSSAAVKLNPGAQNALVGGTISVAGAISAVNSGGSVVNNAALAQSTLAGDAAVLATASAGFKLLAANNTFATSGGGNTGEFVITNVDSNGNAIFAIDGNSILGSNTIGQLNLNLNGNSFGVGQSIVINVSGASINFANKNFLGAFDSLAASNVIWNFFEATQIDLNNSNFRGSLLAPNATLLDLNTIDGSVFAKQIGTNLSNGQRAEIHPPNGGNLYRGFTPTGTPVVPEPASIAMALMGLGAAAGLARFRRVRRVA